MSLPRFTPRQRPPPSLDAPPVPPVELGLDGLPVPERAPPAPLRKPWRSTCRYHLGAPAAAAIKRAGEVDEDGWVLLCVACGRAVRKGSLVILDATGRYRGVVPAVQPAASC